MTATAIGRTKWTLNEDDEGWRDYDLQYLVMTSDVDDGPAVVFFASGLPTIGTPWLFGNDDDPWAHRTPYARVSPIVTKEPNKWWTIDLKFSNRPRWRCQDEQIDDPLAEPQRLSGSFVKYVKKVQKDRNGNLILSSSHELITGLEMDANRPNVIVEQNVSSLGAPTFASMVDTLNDATLWGLAARKIKLSNVSWEKRLYGVCSYYYTRRLEFDIRFEGFDHTDVADAGYKKFDLETWPDTPANRADPTKYVIAKDRAGENSPVKILLDGNGDPLTDPTSPVFLPTIELYPQSNFSLLGIPTSL